MASNPHGRPGQLPSPPSADSPLSPASGSSNPISFRTNVNRAKTKRWAEAKQVSYDGGDWGDGDEEEEEEEEPQPPTAPRPPYANRTGSGSELSSRRLSGLALGAEESRRSPSVDNKKYPSGGSDSKTLPFVRPADISKRMRDETTSPESPGPGAQAEALPNSLQAKATSPVAVGHEGSRSEVNPSGAGQEAPAIGLPEVKRISAFGTDFLGSGDSSSQQHISPDSPQTSLQHNPSQASQGFTSVVHQAFDVPETPNSTTGSVARSNSDGTSLISPIMSNRGPQDDKTPTIPEEPAESSTPTGNRPRAATKDGPVFLPGHRRDMSLPERDNSPSKKPIITDHESPRAGQAEMSAVSRANSSEKDFVAPLKFGSHGSTGSEGYRGEIPTIVPASAGNSPEDTDNDRLREEIIRSLSRENSQEPGIPPHQPSTEGSQEGSIPHQYGNYWDGAADSAPGETPKALVSESHSDWTGPHPLASRDPYAGVQAAGSETQAVKGPPKPKLGRRFSWESSGSADDPTSQIPGSYVSPPLLSTTLAQQEPEPISEDAALEHTKDLPASDSDSSNGPRAEKPRLSIVPPVPENISPPEQIMGPVDAPQSPKAAPLPPVGVVSLDDSKLKGFRDILNMTLPNERIRAFDQTRDQFATLDTGLNHWLQVTINENPDHFDLIQQSRSLASGFPRPSPSRSKFPKLGSLGNLAASKEDGTPTSTTHLRRPSGHLGTIVNRQNVGERGKEFLHTAGAFGGKAGEAAKGLFAKGRSKFRPSGGTDKGQSTTARKSLHFSFTSESNGSHGNTSLRNSVNLGSLPMFKFGASKISTTKEQGDSREERAGKRFKSEEPMGNDSGPDVARRQSGGFNGEADFAGDLEQEMNAALGLSPTEARSKYPAGAKPVMNQVATAQSSQPPPPPTKDGVAAKCRDCGPPGERSCTEKDLPPPPQDDFEIPPAGIAQPSATTGAGVSQAISSSIRPVDDDEKPPLPPKDVPPKKAPQNISLQDRVQSQAIHRRHPSVSTLGVDERANHSAEGDIEDPPSPLQPPQESEPDDPYGKPLPPAKDSSISSSSTEEHVPGFGPVYPPKTASSAQILESKRLSISGLPPSTPGIQSPLRNEVRYSPGTRSSMLSFGSFGRQSNGTRPVTPANGLSQRRGSASPSLNHDDSTMDKLKSFGKRRRASVGDMLSGIQGGIQGGLQGLQNGGQNKDHQRKRTFSRIGGFFNRSQESQNLDGDSHANGRASSQDLGRKVPSTTSSNGPTQSTSSEDKILPSPPVPGLASSLPPVSVDTPASARATHRASMPPPANPSGGSRFYSQLQPARTPSPAQHTRVKSSPMLGNEPLSPIAPSVSDQSGSPPLSHNVYELDEREPEKEASEEQDKARQPQQPEKEGQGQSENQPTIQARASHDSDESSNPIHPSLSVRSRKPVGSDPTKDETSPPGNIAVSDASTLSEHPHRTEARVPDETTAPVELAPTRDDSSEELVMSPTTYPGQEWTPAMHF